MVFMLCTLIDNMGLLCSRQRHNQADSEENEQVNPSWEIHNYYIYFKYNIAWYFFLWVMVILVLIDLP